MDIISLLTLIFLYEKVLIIGCVLLLCCCISSVVAFGLIGHFEANGACAFKGPLSSASTGPCSANSAVTGTTNTTNKPSDTSLSNSTDSNRMDTDFEASSSTYIYTGADYSLEYPKEFTVDDSDSTRLFVYADNGADNLNISSKSLTITATQADCQEYADQAINELSAYDAQLVGLSVVNIGGYKACKTDFTADYGTDSGVVSQTQYYIAAGTTTYFLTITINEDGLNYSPLDDVATSIQFN